MADMLGEAFVVVRATMSRLKGDLAGAGDSIKESLAKSLGNFSLANIGQNFGTMAATSLAGLAPLAVAQQTFSMATAKMSANTAQGIKLSEQLEHAQRRLSAMLAITGNSAGLSAGQLMEHANALDDATGVSKASIIEAQAQLASFRTVNADVFKRATHAALEWSVATGTNLPGAANMLGRALNDPIRGMTMLRRAGVQLSETEQRLVTDFVAAGNAAKAQEVILSALEKKFGDLAERSMPAIERLRNEYEDLLTDIGDLARKQEPLKLKAEIVFAGGQAGFMGAIDNAMRGFGQFLPETIVKNKGEFSKMIGQSFTRAAIQSLTGLPTIPDFRRPEKEGDARKQGPGGLPDNLGRDRLSKMEGFFAPLELARKAQEQMLGKNDQLARLTEEQTSVLRSIDSHIQEGNGETAIPVAMP